MFLIVIILINSISSSTVDIESTTQSLANRVAAEIQELQDKLEDNGKQLKMDRENLKKRNTCRSL